MTKSNAALSRLNSLSLIIEHQLDFVYSIITATYAVGLTSLMRAARWNFGTVALGPLRTAAIIDMHAVLFFELGHPMQGMSAWEYATAAFSSWLLFADGFGKGMPTELAMQSFVERKISLPTFLPFNMCYQICLTLLAIFLSLLPLYILDPLFKTMNMATSTNNVGVNVPAFVSLLAIAYFFGFSLGVLIKKLAKIFPPLSVIAYICLPPMFFLSGVYTSYVLQPDVIQDVMIYSPMLPIVEGCRHALDAGYWPTESTPLYPLAVALVCFVIVLLMDNIKRRVGVGEAKRSH